MSSNEVNDDEERVRFLCATMNYLWRSFAHGKVYAKPEDVFF